MKILCLHGNGTNNEVKFSFFFYFPFLFTESYFIITRTHRSVNEHLLTAFYIKVLKMQIGTTLAMS